MKLRSGLYETEKYHCLGNLNNDNMDLRLIYCGYEDCKPGHRFGPNRRTAYLIHVIVSGKGKLEIGGKVFHLKEGDAFAAKTGYTIDFSAPGDTYEELLKTKMAAKDMPDVFDTHGWSVARYGEFLMLVMRERG